MGVWSATFYQVGIARWWRWPDWHEARRIKVGGSQGKLLDGASQNRVWSPHHPFGLTKLKYSHGIASITLNSAYEKKGWCFKISKKSQELNETYQRKSSKNSEESKHFS